MFPDREGHVANGDDGLPPDDEIPDFGTWDSQPPLFSGSDAAYEMVVLAAFSGASREDVYELQDVMYTGFVSRNVDHWTREAARNEAEAALVHYGLSLRHDFDWRQWRHEMGY